MNNYRKTQAIIVHQVLDQLHMDLNQTMCYITRIQVLDALIQAVYQAGIPAEEFDSKAIEALFTKSIETLEKKLPELLTEIVLEMLQEKHNEPCWVDTSAMVSR